MSADLPCNMTAFFVFIDDELVVDFLFELRYMGDNADEFIAGREALEDFDGLTAGVVIKGTKTFIDKHDIEVDGGGVGLNLVRQA